MPSNMNGSKCSGAGTPRLDRRSFLKTVPAAIGAGLLLAHCGGAATDGSVTAMGTSAVLTFAQFPALQTVGGGVVIDVSGGSPIAVVRTGTTSAVALSAVCTHEGCTVEYVQSPMELSCPCHNSVFTLTGQVTAGPARSALQTFAAAVNPSDITVTIG